MNEHMTNSLVLVVLTHTHLWHFRSFRPCVAGDNQQTSNLFLMLSPETMELERVSGVNAENPMHGHQIKSANSIGFVVDLCWSMLTYWQDLRGWFGTVYRLQICPTFAACTDPLVRTNITISRHLKTAFIPASARSFTMLPSGKLT